MLPRIIGIVRDDQQLQRRPLIEVLAATETCLQGHRPGCDLRLTIADWSGRASQAQRDELEEFVQTTLPKLLKDAKESVASGPAQPPAAALAQLPSAALAHTPAVAGAQTPAVALALAQATSTNQKLVQDNVRLEQEYKKLVLDNAEKLKRLEQHYLREARDTPTELRVPEDSGTASSSAGAVGSQNPQNNRFAREWVAFQQARQEERVAFQQE